jgi:hypothetical protein
LAAGLLDVQLCKIIVYLSDKSRLQQYLRRLRWSNALSESATATSLLYLLEHLHLHASLGVAAARLQGIS